VRFIKIGILALFVLCIAVIVQAAGRRETNYVFNVPDTSVVEINSNRHTQAEKTDQKIQGLVTLDEFEKKLENDTLEIWFNEKNASIRIVDKRSGYIWGFVGVDKPDNLNKSWFGMANSLCTIEYYDKKEAEKKVSLSASEIKKEYQWNVDTLECKLNAEKLGIELAFTMTLKDDHLTFSVVEDSLKENGNSKIKSLYFIPFLGTTQEAEIDGYMFVPDGSGALLRYGTAMEYSSGFSKKVYGADMGIDLLESASGMMASRSDDYLVEEPQVLMPIYGIVHGPEHNGVLAVLDEGEEYATIMANVSGITTNYNWVCARFDYRQSYMHPTTKAGNGIYKPQETANKMKPQISFYFLAGENADYSGMAVYYRELLEEKGVLKAERIDNSVPLHLDLIGADVKKGFLYNPLKVFTKTKEAERILTELDSEGITNITMAYKGWQDGGINGAKFAELDFESRVGKKNDFLSLKERLEENSGRLFLYLNPVTANTEQLNKARQSLVTISKSYARIKRADNQLMFPESFFIKPSIVLNLLEDSREKLDTFAFAYDNLGYRLYADYTRNHWVTRQETKELFEESVALTQDNLALYSPNQYLWQYTTEYFNVPMVNSQYLYETDTVPFLQIVLKGSIDYYAPYANQGYYSTNSILKMIEYGTYPSFIITEALNYELTDTPQVDLFTVNFDDWKNSILNIHQRINEALLPVEGAKMIEHKVITPGVVRILYNNGINIYVNYTTKDLKVDNGTVPALGFAVIER
jgi:hypothetical protein